MSWLWYATYLFVVYKKSWRTGHGYDASKRGGRRHNDRKLCTIYLETLINSYR